MTNGRPGAEWVDCRDGCLGLTELRQQSLAAAAGKWAEERGELRPVAPEVAISVFGHDQFIGPVVAAPELGQVSRIVVEAPRADPGSEGSRPAIDVRGRSRPDER